MPRSRMNPSYWRATAWARGFAPVIPLMVESIGLWQELAREFDVDLEISLGGGLLVAETEAQMRDVMRKAAARARAWTAYRSSRCRRTPGDRALYFAAHDRRRLLSARGKDQSPARHAGDRARGGGRRRDSVAPDPAHGSQNRGRRIYRRNIATATSPPARRQLRRRTGGRDRTIVGRRFRHRRLSDPGQCHRTGGALHQAPRLFRR